MADEDRTMATSPEFKIYGPGGEYEAACKHAETAAAICALLGNGTKIRWCHRHILWTEGKDGLAGESYGVVAHTVHARIAQINQAAYDRAHKKTQALAAKQTAETRDAGEWREVTATVSDD